MTRNYIEFYFDENDIFTAKIHKQGKVRVVRNPKNMEKLIDICYKNGFDVDGEGFIETKIFSITREYEDYINRRRKLRVFGNVLPNMKVSRKNPVAGKTLLAGTLAVVIAASSIGIGTSQKKEETPMNNITMYQEEISQEELEEYKSSVEDWIPSEEIEESESEAELAFMIEDQAFHYSYDIRENDESFQNAERYEELFTKYANRYGLDRNLLMAIAAQESSGDHYGNLGNGPAEGIMQIEKSVHIDSTISAYNFETGEIDSIYITGENLQDLETNIQVGAMVLRNCIETNDYNIPLALQAYNFGQGNIREVIATCSSEKNIDKDILWTSTTRNDWLDYREVIQVGDPLYVEHVLSFLQPNTEISVKKRDNSEIRVPIINDYQRTYQAIT